MDWSYTEHMLALLDWPHRIRTYAQNGSDLRLPSVVGLHDLLGGRLTDLRALERRVLLRHVAVEPYHVDVAATGDGVRHDVLLRCSATRLYR